MFKLANLESEYFGVLSEARFSTVLSPAFIMLWDLRLVAEKPVGIESSLLHLY